MIVCSTQYASEQFSWTGGCGSAEASSLGIPPGCMPFSQIYDDACDIGCTIISSRTGREITFYLAETQTDPNGEFEAWVLRPIPESFRQDAGLGYRARDLEITIWND